MLLHFSIGFYDYRGNTQLRSSIHFSITQILFADHVHWRSGVDNKFSFSKFKSWCIQAPMFRRWEECCFVFPLKFENTFGQPPHWLRGHLALAIMSPPATGPQFLMRWDYADEVHLGKFFRGKDFCFECMRDVQQLLWIFHVGSVSTCLSSSVKSMKTSAAPCPVIHKPIVVYLSSCTPQVRDARDSCHG